MVVSKGRLNISFIWRYLFNQQMGSGATVRRLTDSEFKVEQVKDKAGESSTVAKILEMKIGRRENFYFSLISLFIKKWPLTLPQWHCLDDLPTWHILGRPCRFGLFAQDIACQLAILWKYLFKFLIFDGWLLNCCGMWEIAVDCAL